MHLIVKGSLYCHNICRLPEAIKLVEMYYQDKDKFIGTEALKVQINDNVLNYDILCTVI